MTVEMKAARRNSRVYKDVGKIPGGTARAIRQTWFRLGKDLRHEANKEILRTPKSGKVYMIKGPRGVRRHVASKPGETHANLTGKLRKSLSWKVRGTTQMSFGYGFSVAAGKEAPEYDFIIEFGDAKIKARPSLLNAIRKTNRNTEDHFHREMTAVFGL